MHFDRPHVPNTHTNRLDVSYGHWPLFYWPTLSALSFSVNFNIRRERVYVQYVLNRQLFRNLWKMNRYFVRKVLEREREILILCYPIPTNMRNPYLYLPCVLVNTIAHSVIRHDRLSYLFAPLLLWLRPWLDFLICTNTQFALDGWTMLGEVCVCVLAMMEMLICIFNGQILNCKFAVD